MSRRRRGMVFVLTAVVAAVLAVRAARASGSASTAQATPASLVERFAVTASGPALERPSRAGTFIAAIGPRAAALGYEHRAFEVWAWPLKVLDDLDVAFSLEGYPLPFEGRDLLSFVSVRPESTTLTYAHAAFSVRQTVFVPPDQPAVVVLFDVKSVLPLRIVVRFRPRLRLMWPGTSMTPFVSWDERAQAYDVGEESGRLAAVIAAPGARDLGVMPYQEEPRDAPVSFAFDPDRYDARRQLPAIVVAASVEGRQPAREVAARVLSGVAARHAATVSHYRALLDTTLDVDTPDDRLDRAFAWAKVGIDKGVATNPTLGTGLLAGFRTSGDSERPGFAWFFGRDALWTTLATTAYGHFGTTRAALHFLAKYQREDGKIPHEISQSADRLPWFTAFPYPWASADATPLFVIAHGDYWQATGDRAFLDASWPAIVKAYEFSRATDRDGDALIENTNVGHGWVEGGALYPAHEEVYLQGLWVQAQRTIGLLARVRGDAALAERAAAGAERTRQATESTFWMEQPGHYAFATRTPTAEPRVAEPGPSRARRQAALKALAPATRIDEDTVLPAVPLWWRLVDAARAERQIDRLGSGALATDWGTRLLSRASELYDPLSYHFGSVWPLFTGWAAMAAYEYGRPYVGYQMLMANALLTETGALGAVTELISGEMATAFGRSSHHQIWSQAMVAAPLVRGLLGIAVENGGTKLTIAPQLPADWPFLRVKRIPVAGTAVDLDVERSPGRAVMTVRQSLRTGEAPAAARPLSLVVGAALPLDAIVKRVTIDGRARTPAIDREGDVQRIRVSVETAAMPVRLELTYAPGTELTFPIAEAQPGAESQGLRLLRVRPEPGFVRLLVEGRGQRTYRVTVRSPRAIGATEGVTLLERDGESQHIAIKFSGSPDDYVRQDLRLPLAR